MPNTHSFEYAVIRIVPHVERGEFINAGVILYCRALRYLDCRLHLDLARLACLAPAADVGLIQQELDVIAPICAGGAGAGPLAGLNQAERFRWLASPRSTCVQPSPVHGGVTDDPAAALSDLFDKMVQMPGFGDLGR